MQTVGYRCVIEIVDYKRLGLIDNELWEVNISFQQDSIMKTFINREPKDL